MPYNNYFMSLLHPSQFSQTLAPLTLLQSLSTTHPLVQEIQDWLFRVSVRHKFVCFCWVPSHVGITGNERVDSLARNIPLTDRPRSQNLPASDYYPLSRTFPTMDPMAKVLVHHYRQ